ncbi:hypothetical protein ACEPAF_9062 [Sanghuangporus sanghuang]
MDLIKNPVSLVSSLRLQCWCSFGVTVLLVYDIIVTVDEEVEYFWGSRLSLIHLIFFMVAINQRLKVLFLMTHLDAVHRGDTKYCQYLFKHTLGASILVIFFHVLLTSRLRYSLCISLRCRSALWSASIIDWAIIACIDYILYLRVRALYSFGGSQTNSVIEHSYKWETETRYRSVVLGLQILYFINVSVGVGSLIASLLKTGAFIHVISKNMRYCDYTSGKLQVSLRGIFWSAPLAYGSILLVLALYKAAHIRKSLGYRGLKLVKVLIIDQALYFVSVIVCSIANIVTNVGPLQNLPAFLFALQVIGGAGFLSLLGSRMLIRLKQVSGRTTEEASFGLSSDVSDPEFRTYGIDENTRSVQYSWALGD